MEMCCVGIASLFVSLNLALAAQNTPLKNIFTAGSHLAKPLGKSNESKGMNPLRNRILPERLLKLSRDNSPTVETSEKLRLGLPSIPIPNQGANDIHRKPIHSDGILSDVPTQYDSECQPTVHPCVKPCVCFECPYTRQFIVNCSGKSLSYIPNGIPQNVTHLLLGNNLISHLQSLSFETFQTLHSLDMSNNSLSHLENSSFVGLTKLKHLSLKNNRLRIIHRDAFKPLSMIDTLDVGYNQELGLKNAGTSFAGLIHSPIRRLFVQNVQQEPELIILRREDMQYLKRTHLEELYLDNNTISQIDSNIIEVLPSALRVFSISWNDIQTYTTQILLLLRLWNLEYFYASYQEVYRIRKKTSGVHTDYPGMRSDTSGFRNSLSHSQNIPGFGKMSTFGSPIQLILPPNLTEVQFSHTYKLRFAIPEMNLLAPNLRKVDLSYSLLDRWNGPIMGMAALEELDLTGNTCHELSPNFFSYFHDLKYLKIGNNFLGPELKEGSFNGLGNLERLDMHTNRLERITLGLFSDLRNLKVLNLSNNYITSWKDRISHLRNLTLLDLSSNKLSFIPSELLRELDEISKYNVINISVKGNPLLCNCDTKYFLDWLKHTHVRLENARFTYCIMESGNLTVLAGQELVSLYNILEIHCRSYTSLVVVLSCIIALVVCIIFGKMFHRYRWKLRYLYYMAVNSGERTGYDRLDGVEEEAFTFDLFISYEDSNRDFVRLEMLSMLETEAGLKLCIDKRDFIPGFYVADNIMNAIQNSRKTAVLLSKKFLLSKWCMYEFNMARMESIYSDRHSLIVVLMESIPINELPAEVMEILHGKSYIIKTEDPDGTILFWRQLIAGIRLDKTRNVAVI